MRASASRTHFSAVAGPPAAAQHVHHLLVGAAVQPALQRADGRDDARMQVRLRRADDAGRERRGVELVLGVQDQRHVQGPHRVGRRFPAAQHVKEVGGVAQVGPGGDRRQAVAEAPVRRDGHGDLAEQSFRLAQAGGVATGLAFPGRSGPGR